MAKNSSNSEPSVEQTAAGTDQAAVNEPTQHVMPTQQTAGSEPQWGVATEELFVGGVRAHNVGDRVPLDNVDRNGWGGKVTAI